MPKKSEKILEKKFEKSLGKKKDKMKIHSHGKLHGLGGEVRRPATRSRKQGKSFAENLR
jgi:hypothetical protein